jgi:hypothetical protein
MKTPNPTKSSKVGSLVLATDQGLGYLAKAFYDNGIIDVVSVHSHGTRTNHLDWYPQRVSKEKLLECDTLLFFETPFDWSLIPKARAKGIKTILMPMYECTNHPLPYVPDLLISPSLLDQKYYPDSLFVPVPVEVKWRERTRAEVFVHNAGNGGLGGRNGTKELLEAMQYVQSPIKLIVRSQVPIKEYPDPRIEYRIGTFDNIWEEGDVFIFPEKFNGLSLPLQEAYASGLLVMAGDRFPINTWLPREPLIPVSDFHSEKLYRPFNVADYDPRIIAQTIDEWFGQDIKKFSLQGKAWGEAQSWTNLKAKYLSLCEK